MMWLSFVDPKAPAEARLLGIAIVLANDIISAIKIAHALGINPGGEVMGMLKRLLPPAGARELAMRIERDLAS